jgi:2-amino-4-hydroxy-6-hydroxymethyldihydropteridine diphosphokinase
MARVYVSVGSNINPLYHIRQGLAKLQQHYGSLILSSVYESYPVGFSGDNFYNLVVGFDTTSDAYTVNVILHQIEHQQGRQQQGEKAYNARTLDLDLLLYDDVIIKDSILEIPRPEIMQYAFVLLPLSEIAPDARHPLTQAYYADMWQQFDQQNQSLWRVSVDVDPSKN